MYSYLKYTVLAVFKDTELYLPVLLGVGLGLRRGEALGLRCQDIDIKNKLFISNIRLLKKQAEQFCKQQKMNLAEEV